MKGRSDNVTHFETVVHIVVQVHTKKNCDPMACDMMSAECAQTLQCMQLLSVLFFNLSDCLCSRSLVYLCVSERRECVFGD